MARIPTRTPNTPAKVARINKDVLMDEVISSESVAQFPELVDLSERDMLVMMGVAHGFSYRYIARAMKLSVARVCQISKAHDPDGVYRLNEESMKAFIKRRAMAKQAEAIGVITPEKLEQCSASEASKVVKTMAEVANIQDKKNDNLDRKIKKLVVEFVDPVDELPEADYEEMD